MFFLIFNDEASALAFKDSYNSFAPTKQKDGQFAVGVGFSIPESIPDGATVSDYGTMAREGWSPQPQQ